MITDIEINGFQSHEESSLTLSPGVNVIIGKSDSGKSSIIRLLEWVFKNRPKGDSFRNNTFGKEDIVSGGIAFDDGGWIIRSKNNKINQYKIESGVLKALRTDVPQEISAISKIKDVNIQSQHPTEQYFMLTESPGQVAKKFNKVVGLTVMDDSLIKINSFVRSTKHKVDSVNESIVSHKKKIKSLEWTKTASIALEQLTKDDITIKTKIQKSDALFDIVEEYKSMQKKYSKLKGLSKAVQAHTEVSQIIYEVQNKIQYVEDLKKVINAIKNIDLILTDSELLKKAISQIPALFSQKEASINKIKHLEAIKKVIFDIKCLNDIELELDLEVHDLKKEWDSYTGAECPLCGNTLQNY